MIDGGVAGRVATRRAQRVGGRFDNLPRAIMLARRASHCAPARQRPQGPTGHCRCPCGAGASIIGPLAMPRGPCRAGSVVQPAARRRRLDSFAGNDRADRDHAGLHDHPPTGRRVLADDFRSNAGLAGRHPVASTLDLTDRSASIPGSRCARKRASANVERGGPCPPGSGSTGAARR